MFENLLGTKEERDARRSGREGDHQRMRKGAQRLARGEGNFGMYSSGLDSNHSVSSESRTVEVDVAAKLATITTQKPGGPEIVRVIPVEPLPLPHIDSIPGEPFVEPILVIDRVEKNK